MDLVAFEEEIELAHGENPEMAIRAISNVMEYAQMSAEEEKLMLDLLAKYMFRL